MVFHQYQLGTGLPFDTAQLRVDDFQIDRFNQDFGAKLSAGRPVLKQRRI
jgi:hypothetical protein